MSGGRGSLRNAGAGPGDSGDSVNATAPPQTPPRVAGTAKAGTGRSRNAQRRVEGKIADALQERMKLRER